MDLNKLDLSYDIVVNAPVSMVFSFSLVSKANEFENPVLEKTQRKFKHQKIFFEIIAFFFDFLHFF